MAEWGFWDWVSYLGLGASVLGLALREWLKKHSRILVSLPDAFKSGRWAYVPLVFFLLATSVFAGKQFGILHDGRTLTSPQQPRTIFVPVQDQKLKDRIAALEKQLSQAVRTEPKPRPKILRPTSAAPAEISPKLAEQPANSLKAEDQALLDHLRCQKDAEEIQNRLSSFIRTAKFSQDWIGDAKDASDTYDADTYGNWLAEVEVWLKAHPIAGFEIAQFDAAHGNDFMKPPSQLTANQAKVWKEFEAKKSILEREKVAQSFMRCD